MGRLRRLTSGRRTRAAARFDCAPSRCATELFADPRPLSDRNLAQVRAVAMASGKDPLERRRDPSAATYLRDKSLPRDPARAFSMY